MPCQLVNYLLCLVVMSRRPAFFEERLPCFREETIDPGAEWVTRSRWPISITTERTDIVVLLRIRTRCLVREPDWKTTRNLEGAPKLPVCVQPLDVDDDGKVELILGADWQPSNTKTGGTIWLLRRPSDLNQQWTPIKIDEEPTMHRMRVMDVDGRGTKELVCSPLQGRETKGPEWWNGSGVSLFLLRRPAKPFTEPWKREVINNELHINHNVWTLDWDGDRKEEILAAAWEGIFIFRKAADGKWAKQKIGEGHPERRGAGEIKAGRLPGGKRYLATIEPWHGQEAVVYTSPAQSNQLWKRRALVEGHKGGHVIWTADLTGTGADSLVVGFRGPPEGTLEDGIVYLFHPLDSSGENWEKQVLDAKGLGSEDVVCADLDGDRKVDIDRCWSRSTKNVKVYWNQGRAR